MAKSVTAHLPWKPASYEVADAYAIQRLADGTADADMQRRALKWLIDVACGTYDQTYFPGPEGQRDSDFAQGKRAVGLSIVKMLKLNTSKLTENDNAPRSSSTAKR